MFRLRKENKMRQKKSYKWYSNKWLPLIGLLLVFAVLVGLVIAEDRYKNTDDVSGGNTLEKVTFPQIEEEVLLCSKVAKMLYDGEIEISKAVQTDDPYRPLVLEYDSGNLAGTLYLSEKADMQDAVEYELPAFGKVARIDNLKTGTQYYYKIVFGAEEQSGSFKTQESTRYITMPGLENIRDIGGVSNLDGQKLRQGLLIRGTEIDGLEYSEYKLTPLAAEEIQKTFGFVYDFDLRWDTLADSTYRTPLGSNVAHKFYCAPQYEQILNPDWHPSVRKIFSDLAKPENYPMYLHCTWGKDRTGTIVFLLQGVLNVSEADMMREFLLSAYIHDEMIEDKAMEPVISGLMQYKGGTLQEKIVTYLTEDVGVTTEEIAAIREIFLSDKGELAK